MVAISPPGAVTAGAQWSVDGGTTWNDSGATGRLSGITAGDHTLSFSAVPGFATPLDRTVKIIAGRTIGAAVMYKGYSVTAKSSSGGSVTPAKQVVKTDPTITFTLKPKTGYTTSSTVGGTCPAGTLDTAAMTYTTGAMTTDCTVLITFVKSPTVTTGSAAKITQTGATLNGRVNPENDPTTVTFEYGLDTTYGTVLSGGGTLTGGKSKAVSAVVADLTCGSTYHFRVVAVNAIDPFTTNGLDRTFKTPKCADPAADSNISTPVSDFDGDGKSDILLRDAVTGQTSIWMMNGVTVTSTALTSLNAGPYTPASGWQAQGIGDFDGDGKYDVLWRDYATGELAVWAMNGATVVTSYMASMIPGAYTATTGWQVHGVGDFNGDGKSDILWRHASAGQTAIWFMDGATVTSAANTSATATAGWQVQGVGDFNGDGKADILWRNAGTGKTSIWFMDGATKIGAGYTNVQAGLYSSTMGWQIQGVGDFNGDGRSDILWRNAETGKTAIWFMNGSVKASSGYTSIQPGLYTPATGWQIQGVGDFNGDGMSDVLLQYAGTGQTYIWLMNGTVVTGDWTSATPGAYTPTTGLQVVTGKTIR
jgi:hypothetical protein